MRLYSIAVAALAVGAPLKWADNVLSQHEIPDVQHRRRGAARGISWNALVRLNLIRALNQELGCGVRDAVTLSSTLIDGPGLFDAGGFLTVTLDRPALEAALRGRL